MAKANAQKQRKYRKRKKWESNKFLKKGKEKAKKSIMGKRHNLLKTAKRGKTSG